MNCRNCKTALNQLFLDLGAAPPSNAYLTSQELQTAEPYFPLRLFVCNNCWLVQTEDYAGREALFTKDYAYFSSFSTTWLTHAQTYVNMMINRFGLDHTHCVVEIAANDGYLLQYVQQAGITCYGIEPTSSTANAARSKGLEIIEQFFGTRLADELVQAGRHADLIIANNVLAHVPDINDFVAGFTKLLKPSGVATFEFPHLLQMVRENQFDTAYHEHYSYLSLTTVQQILVQNGLTPFDVEELPTHGGSLRLFVQRSDTGIYPLSPAVAALLQMEAAQGVTILAFYQEFQARAEKVKNDLLLFLLDVKKQSKKVCGYGAAAKGNTLLNFAGVKPDLLPFVVDKNPAKQGKYLPGSRIPIVDETSLKNNEPDYILILPWNLAEEVTEQLEYVGKWDGQFVVAVPELRVIRSSGPSNGYRDGQNV